MRGDKRSSDCDSEEDDIFVDPDYTQEKRSRRRTFLAESLQSIENVRGDRESRKRKSTDSTSSEKRLRYDDDDDYLTMRCKHCRRSMRQAKQNRFIEDDFPKSQDEETCLQNDYLNVVVEEGEKAQIKLTSYCVYDEKKHMCSFDNDIIKNGTDLYAAGYAKPIHTENSEIGDGVPMRKIGPLTSWWITGFDGGEKAILGVSTELADYYLMRPNSKFEPFLRDANLKMCMVKLVVEFLRESEEDESTYDNLLSKLQVTVPPPGFTTLTEEDLLTHAESIYDLVINQDAQLVNAQCMKHLARLAGISFEERLTKIRVVKRTKRSWVERNNEMTKAATTNLVQNVFGSFFPGQMDKSYSHHLSLIKKCCVLLNRCDNLLKNGLFKINGIKEDDIIGHTLIVADNLLPHKIEPENDNGNTALNGAYGKPFSISLELWTDDMIKKYVKSIKSKEKPIKRKGKYTFRNGGSSNVRVKFIGEADLVQDDRFYFKEAMVSDLSVHVDDFVSIGEHYDSTNQIGRVIYMWEEEDEKLFHIHWLVNSTDTLLGDIGNQQELFDTYDCEDLPLSMIENKVTVTYLPIKHETWVHAGNGSFNEWQNSSASSDENSYIYQKLFDATFGRFEDVIEVSSENRLIDHCTYCERNVEKELSEKPMLDANPEYNKTISKYSYKWLRWRKEEFKVGSCVFIKSGTLFSGKENNKPKKINTLKTVDEERYPEHYRKDKERRYSRPIEDVHPFDIGYIMSIESTKRTRNPENITLIVKKLYRPENTHLDEHIMKHLDLNLVYWTDEECVVPFSEVEGKCYVANSRNLSCTADEWTRGGPYRFYYEEEYIPKERKFVPAPKMTTRDVKCNGIRPKSNSLERIIEEIPKPWPSLSRPLHSLDIFAGCGGLTEGLHQAGIAEVHWAIEKEDAAAHAFRLNYPNAKVFADDCNKLLKMIMTGQTRKDGQALPQKGQVELLCGGPPCQGFSRMNRFHDRQYSAFKNSLVVSFLSYVDYFRPRYVIMENVRNFVIFKKNTVLKLTLSCLLKMGYQCTFGVLQAGHFGVPQNRRRAIILAAAPGEILPKYPEPTNSFEENAITVLVDGQKVTTNVNWESSAPYRKLSVYDAISDLPTIPSGGDPENCEMSYKAEAKTHFQRMMRRSNDILRDHVSKTINPLVEKRITFIPRVPGSDWRDLPNIVVTLPDGSKTKKLVYTHHDIQMGKSKNGELRGVCPCAAGKKCDPKYRQLDTLIPWCLPHTGNRNHHWSGLYGRIEWDGHFKTVITNLDPLAKQGRVLHPEQDRIVSVREVARSQGFPDKFRFFGTTQDRYRQIGNAVPPPLAAALGREIAKCVAEVEKRSPKKTDED
ncbi:DNA (cytosine-5)-methyltransferase PliMCI-like isoform X2 [Planococcus citri]|uniref:DNA (cytosine-5)-methyltransferase PliMCI-like isoform X2 n=1 Tax=Planococcus citri TaxID=170843 RepID=UPI0031F78EFC